MKENDETREETLQDSGEEILQDSKEETLQDSREEAPAPQPTNLYSKVTSAAIMISALPTETPQVSSGSIPISGFTIMKNISSNPSIDSHVILKKSISLLRLN